jgi:predicted nucleic acid-binding protein
VPVLVDTNIWSLALRRHKTHLSESESEQVAALRELILEGRARIIGPIRQELLSGIREPAQFKSVRDELRVFPDEVLAQSDYEEAAHWSNECRRRGIAGSGVDFLMCSVAVIRGWQIFTIDADFRAFSKIIPIQLRVF